MMFPLLGVVTLLQMQDTLALTLDQAAARAGAVSPRILAAEGAIRAPRGLREESRWPFPSNPTLSLGRTARRSPPATTQDRAWEVSQEVDVAGAWVYRTRAATSLIQAFEARADDARRLVALEARLAYLDVAIAERRAALTDSAAAFAEHLSEQASRQLAAGEINRLERNAAALEAARARSAADRFGAEATAARAELARVLGLPRDTVPRTTELPAMPSLVWPGDSVLLQLARSRRPDLRAGELLRRSADRSVTAAAVARAPSLVAAAFGGRESGTDRLRGVQLGVSIPLFRRQQAALGEAEAARVAADADLTATDRAVMAEVLAASARFRRAVISERRFASEVLRAATENVTLTERALTEGEASLTDVLVLRGTAVAAQLEYLEVLREAATAWFDLAAALASEPAALAQLLNRGR
ncbi:MAG: TolC family protein [Gemmatimonadetes bacterium]|nr:TolC family protein [Gemmatimonadota bacterium]